jgi:Family of unknown function (DUF6159)
LFATIGHTFELMKMSWGVLRRDRELVAFPLMGLAAILALVALFGGVGWTTGALDRLMAAADNESVRAMTPGDWVLYVAFYFSAYFTGIYFNSALVAAALERLRGGDPTVASGLRVATSRLPAILGWTLIAATVGLILSMIRERSDSFLGRILASLVEGVWAYITFFVIPVLVAENVGPIEAVRRSGALFRQSWGRQFTAAFGFGLVYLVAVLAAVAVSVAAFAIHPVVGIPVAVTAFALAIGTVSALEGIFKAALYDYSVGGSPAGFERGTLASAYRAL